MNPARTAAIARVPAVAASAWQRFGATRRERWITVAQVVATVLLVYAWIDVGRHRSDNDAFGYWNAWDGGLYDIPWLTHGAYTYSPAFAEVIYPWTLLSWKVAWMLESGLQIAALGLIAGPLLAVALYYVPWLPAAGYPNPVEATIHNGNIHLLIALTIVAAYRWPWAWTLVFHTKIVPGIAVLWYPLRRQWRRAMIAVIPAVAVTIVSFLLTPAPWWDFGAMLATAAGQNTAALEPFVPLPLMVRLPIGVAVMWVAARSDRYWLVPVAAMLALPAIRIGGVAVAVAAIPFVLANSRLDWVLPRPLRRLWAIDRSGGRRSTGLSRTVPDRPASR